jgi:xylulokinase
MAGEFGLPVGVPVFVGPMDGLCGIIGSGIKDRGQMSDIAGSTEVMATPVPRGSKLAMLPLLDTGIHLYYTSPPLGLAYRWFLDNFYAGSRSAYKAIAADIAASSADPDRPYFVPTLKPIGPQKSVRSSFFNLALNHARRDMARAVFEGIAFEVARVVDRLAEDGVSIGEIRLSGGGAYQDAWNQIRADATGREVVLPRVLETSSLGAAIVAASSSMGPYKGLEEGMSMMVKMGKRYRPRKAAMEAYRERLVIHRRYADLLAETW